MKTEELLECVLEAGKHPLVKAMDIVCLDPFSIFMTIGAMETHKVLFSIFVLIDVLFVGLALTTFGIAPEATHQLAAVAELLIALLSFYGSAAAVLNPHFGKVVLPVGKPFGIFKTNVQLKMVKKA